MALDDLVSSQPDSSVPPSEQEETAMDEQVEEASETTVNSDGETTEAQEAGDDNSRIQKRINELTRQKREFEEQLLQERAAREAIERNMEHFQSGQKEQTLADLDIAALKQFIKNADGDEDLERHIPEAKELILEKQIEEKFKKFEDTRNSKQVEEENKQLTNTMLNNLSGGKLSDQDGEYFHTAQNYLYDLENKYNGVNAKQLLAVALAENDYLKSQKAGPSVVDRVVENRNQNTIKANSRASNAGGSDLDGFLKDNQRLTRSSQGKSGSLKDAIKRLGVVQYYEGG
jgi:hypothetical protein